MPVGVSIKYPGRKAHYYAFGHPSENNCTVKEAAAALAAAWEWPGGILFFHMKFDLDVAHEFFGLPIPAWEKTHDAMFQVFLDNPHAPSHGLKQSAERLLGKPPEEQDAVRDWLVCHGVVTRAAKDAGAFISCAPGGLVGIYANGDGSRTEGLHKKLMPTLKKRKMLGAYDRERQLVPVLLDMEQQGVPVDHGRLRADVSTYSKELAEMTGWIQRRLKAKINVDSGEALVDALIKADKVDLSLLGKTPTGAWKTDKKSLAAAIVDTTLASMLAHRASLATCVGTFMAPWLLTADTSGGLIYTGWNQLKQYAGRGAVGAVTGRMSSSPNFQNVPKSFPPFWKHEVQAKLDRETNPKKIEELKAKLKVTPKMPIELTALPLVRSYIVAPKGYTLIDRDYSQQELRILAHFEDGLMLQAYLENPWLDIHNHVKAEILRSLDKDFERNVVKQINFGLIYGMGVAKMADAAGCSVEEARAAKGAVLSIYPGLRELQDGLKELAANNEPLRTWGGRLYHCEPAKMIDGEVRTFEYKMLNVLIQGSAADCTKQAMINYYRVKPPRHQLMLQVHDELLACVPTNEVETGMELLRESMESVKFAVPMLSEGKTSTTNWSELRAFDKEGLRV